MFWSEAFEFRRKGGQGNIEGRGKVTEKGAAAVPVVGAILAAGQGKRLRSRIPKVRHEIAGESFLSLVLHILKEAGVEKRVVVAAPGSGVEEDLPPGVEVCFQEKPRGTADAVAAALRHLGEEDFTLLVVNGDTPLLRPETLARFVQDHLASGRACTLLTARLQDPTGYGRVKRDAEGGVVEVVEEKDASPQERAICEVSSGVWCFAAAPLRRVLPLVRPDNRQSELYLPDVVPLLRERGYRTGAVEAEEPEEILGINTREELARAEAALRERTVRRWMEEGVTVVDPLSVYISPRARIGMDTVIYPHTFIYGETVIGGGCRIGPFSFLRSCRLEDGVEFFFSVAEESFLGAGSRVGPFSHLRPGTRLAAGVKVGNFAEIKNSSLGEGTKVPHHSYLGDAEVGRGVNIGAGAITVNFDGLKKHPTRIEDHAFIGCNVNLIAPLVVGQGAMVAAGSTVNRDVPPEALAIARSRQENKEGWVKKRKRRHE